MRALLALLLLVGAGPVVAEEIVPAGRLADAVAIADVRRDPDALRGRLTNRSAATLSQIQLLATDAFLWTDERHPGPDDPGLSGTVTVPGPLAPGESLPFAVPLPPRPPRTDGTFVPRVTVLGLTTTAAATP
jgi:hypothetical protein